MGQLKVSILAGGLSQRMGADKARLRLGKLTLLGHVKQLAAELDKAPCVVRRDFLPRCGPLGGVYTALIRCPAQALLFLACDMPFVPGVLLRRLKAKFEASQRPIFVVTARGVGFPFILPHSVVKIVLRQIECGEYSLAALCKAVGGLRMAVTNSDHLRNINTPKELAAAQAALGLIKTRPKSIFKHRQGERVELRSASCRRAS